MMYLTNYNVIIMFRWHVLKVKSMTSMSYYFFKICVSVKTVQIVGDHVMAEDILFLFVCYICKGLFITACI